MIPRFFVPSAETTGSVVELPDEEAGHLIRVLRLGEGAAVRVFDGRGHEWQGIVARLAKRTAAVQLVASEQPAPEPGVDLVLSIAILKSDKMDDVVRDAVMLGVAAIRPVLSERSELRASVVTRSGRVARWQRIAVASAKQSGRAVVPEILPVATLDEMLAVPPERTRIALVEPGAGVRTCRLGDLPRATAVELVVGPEGGWTGGEVQQLGAVSMLVTQGLATQRHQHTDGAARDLGRSLTEG